MSTAYTPTATYHATTTLPDDGDPDFPSASAIMAPVEAALDNAQYLKNRLVGPQIAVPLTPANIYGLSNEAGVVADRFQFATLANVGGGWLQTDVTDAGALVFPLSHVLGSKLTIAYISATVACAAHAGDPVAGGATLPKLSLLSEDTSQKTSMIVNATQADLSPSKAAYEARHLIVLDCVALFGGAGLVWDVNADLLYYLKFEGETNGGGAGAQASKLLLKALYVTPVVP